MVSIEDFKCIIDIKKVEIGFFDELGEELGLFDITEHIPNFNEKDGDWIHGDNEGLFLFYDILGDTVSNEDIE